jgi:hypothetical protein
MAVCQGGKNDRHLEGRAASLLQDCHDSIVNDKYVCVILLLPALHSRDTSEKKLLLRVPWTPVVQIC